MSENRREFLAVNLFDLDRVEPMVRQALLADTLDLDSVIKADDDKPDERAVRFKCPFLRAALICDILRNHDRQVGDPPTRIYMSRMSGPFRVGWRKLPGNLVLTATVNDKVTLNPLLFEEGAREVALPAKKVEMGRKAKKGAQ